MNAEHVSLMRRTIKGCGRARFVSYGPDCLVGEGQKPLFARCWSNATIALEFWPDQDALLWQAEQALAAAFLDKTENPNGHDHHHGSYSDYGDSYVRGTVRKHRPIHSAPNSKLPQPLYSEAGEPPSVLLKKAETLFVRFGPKVTISGLRPNGR